MVKQRPEVVSKVVVCVADVIASRGERLELLVDKAEDLSNSVCAGFSLYQSISQSINVM